MSVLSIVGDILTSLVGGVRDHIKGKQDIQKAVVENKIRLAKSESEYNHEWEMRQLTNAGWKDDVLFYAWLVFFVWSGFDPDGASRVVQAWGVLPDWFLEVTFWIVAAVLGVKKLGDQLPGTVRAMRGVFSRDGSAAGDGQRAPQGGGKDGEKGVE
ncbi:MAG: hypothetical protein AB7D57_14665 [Desulfovibrionaceae bacterium]